jgi:hypothetical protein
MQIKGAMTVLNRRAQFYGKTLDWLINAMDNHMDENMTVTQAYEVYKMHNGYRWKGTEGDTWVKSCSTV